MKRIAYLASEYDAPSHTFIRREVDGLRRLGMDVDCFSIQPAASGEAQGILGRSPFAYLVALLAAFLGHPLRFLSTWRLALSHRPPGLRALLWAQFHFVEAVLLSQLLRGAGIGHLHNHFANSGASVGMLAAHFLQIPWSLTLHGISETDYPSGVMLPDKLERADFVACASYFMRAQAMRLIGPDQWPKFHIVRCGVDLDTLKKLASTSREGDVPCLVCVARLSPEKGHSGLIDVLGHLRGEGIAFELVLVGDGPMGLDLQRHIAELNLEDRVSMPGYLTEHETLQVIADADILVLASFMEGLPVVLIEAAALAKPVIASRVAGIPELVEHGETGLLFTPSDWAALEVMLRSLLGDRHSWSRLGKAARLRAEAEFSIDQSAARMRALFSGDQTV